MCSYQTLQGKTQHLYESGLSTAPYFLKMKRTPAFQLSFKGVLTSLGVMILFALLGESLIGPITPAVERLE